MSCLEVTNDNNLAKYNNNQKNGVWFVWFYAEWCGHCRDMEEPWKKLAENNHNKVNLAKVRDDYIPRLNDSPLVQGYPTIILYKNGKPVDTYQGERSEEGFNNYLNENVNANENNAVQMNNSGVELNNLVELKKPAKKKKQKKTAKKKKSNGNKKKKSNGKKKKKKTNKKQKTSK